MFTRYGNSSAHNTVDAQGHVGGPYRMGVNGAHNTIEGNVGAYNIACVRAVVEYYSYRLIGYGPWYSGLTCAP